MSDKSRLNRVLLFFGLLLCVFDLTKPLEQYHPEDLHVNRCILSKLSQAFQVFIVNIVNK